MADFLTAMGAPAVRTVGDVTYTFPQLTMQQIGVFLAKQRQAKLVNARAMLDEMKADPSTRFQCLQLIEQKFSAFGSFDLYALTPEGCLDIFKVAFGTQTPSADGFSARFVSDVVTELVFGREDAPQGAPKSADNAPAPSV